jgi:alpha-1,3-rhamnosyl/mannosyltransferase
VRVAIDTSGIYTGQAGGARYIRGLLRGLGNIQSGVDWFPIAWEVENLAYRQPQRACKTLYREVFWANFVAPSLLRQKAADVFHSTGTYFISVPRHVKKVVTLHDLAVLRTPRRFRRWTRWSETRRLQRLTSVDRVICISRFTADEARLLLGLPSSKIEVVYNGGDFQPHDLAITQQAPDFPVPAEFFLFVGSLEPGKNLSLLRDTYRLAANEGKVLPPLLIIGVRWAGVGTEGEAPVGWHYLGRQSDAVLVYLYRRALALAFPSKYEGFGLPVVEAMALGCPVICSRVASLPEVGGKAVLWSDLTPAGYLSAMLEMQSNSALRSELIRAGCEQARQFTWERCAQGVVDVYRSVAG